MTSSALPIAGQPARSSSRPPRRHPWIADRAPVAVVVAALIAIWYVAAIAMNLSLVRDGFEREETPYTVSDLIEG